MSWNPWGGLLPADLLRRYSLGERDFRGEPPVVPAAEIRRREVVSHQLPHGLVLRHDAILRSGETLWTVHWRLSWPGISPCVRQDVWYGQTADRLRDSIRRQIARYERILRTPSQNQESLQRVAGG